MRDFILSFKGVIAFIILVVIAAGAWKLKDVNIIPAPNDNGGGAGVVCTADAMQCPDGSYVGRSGPNCEFVCPDSTAGTPPSGGGSGILPYNSGIRGTVMAGPTCPVERDPPDPNCADKPLSVLVSV